MRPGLAPSVGVAMDTAQRAQCYPTAYSYCTEHRVHRQHDHRQMMCARVKRSELTSYEEQRYTQKIPI